MSTSVVKTYSSRRSVMRGESSRTRCAARNIAKACPFIAFLRDLPRQQVEFEALTYSVTISSKKISGPNTTSQWVSNCVECLPRCDLNSSTIPPLYHHYVVQAGHLFMLSRPFWHCSSHMKGSHFFMSCENG